MTSPRMHGLRQTQLDVARQNLFGLLKAQGQTDVHAMRVVDTVFSGKEIHFQLPGPDQDDVEVADKDEDKQDRSQIIYSPVSSSGSVSPHSQQPQFRQRPHQRGEHCLSPNANMASGLQACFSSTKPPTACQAANDITLRSRAPSSPRPDDVTSPGLSTVLCTPPPAMKFGVWRAGIIAAADGDATACLMARLLQPNAAADMDGKADSEDAAETPTIVRCHTHEVEAETAKPIPFQELALAQPGFLAPFLTTPCSGAPLSATTGAHEEGSRPPSGCLSTVSRAPPPMPFPEWCGLHQCDADDWEAIALQPSLQYLARSLHRLALDDVGTLCSGCGSGNLTLQSPGAYATPPRPKMQQPVAAALGPRARADHGQWGRTFAADGPPLSALACRKATAPLSPC